MDGGMKISTAKTENMCLSRHPVQCSFQTNGVTLQQIVKFQYNSVTLSSDGKQNELDSRIEKASVECACLECEKSEVYPYLTRLKTLTFVNLATSKRC